MSNIEYPMLNVEVNRKTKAKGINRTVFAFGVQREA
jgi:hypothetical protein